MRVAVPKAHLSKTMKLRKLEIAARTIGITLIKFFYGNHL